MQPEKEEILKQGLLNGEEGAYRFLFHTYYQPMCLLAASILKDDYLAEATVSDVISHIYEKRNEIIIHSSLRSYLMTSTRNACLNALGTKTMRTEQNVSSLSETEVHAILRGSDALTPQGKLLSDEFQHMVQDFVDTLPQTVRSSFVKSKYMGKTYREIGEEDGVSINTVKVRIQSALKLFRERFANYFDEQR